MIHTHADAVVSLTNNDRSRRRPARGLRRGRHRARRTGGPGFLISREVAADLRGAPEGARPAAREARDDLLGRHREGGLPRHDRADQPRGGGDRPSRAGAGALRRRRACASPPPDERRRVALAVAPRLRGLVGRDRRQVVVSSTTRRTCSSSPARARRRRSAGSGRPRRTTRSTPSGCRASRRSTNPADPESVARRRHARRWSASSPTTPPTSRPTTTGGATLHGPVPARGRGGAGSACSPPARTGAPPASSTTSTTTRSRCWARPPPSARYVSLTARDAFDVEYWPLELYKLTLAPPEKELARRIALVTGGASRHRARGGPAAGRRGRARGGGRPRRGGRAQGGRRDRRGAVGAGRALGLGMDVTSEASVRAAFEEAVLAYGGARHRGLQRGHRALVAGGPDGARRLGALLRGELHRPLPGGARGACGC